MGVWLVIVYCEHKSRDLKTLPNSPGKLYLLLAPPAATGGRVSELLAAVGTGPAGMVDPGLGIVAGERLDSGLVIGTGRRLDKLPSPSGAKICSVIR